MLATLLSLTLSCLSTYDGDAVVSSPNKAFTLDARMSRLTLLEGDKPAPPPGELPTGVLWQTAHEQPVDAYVVSDDGTWVVAARSVPRFTEPEQGVVVLFDEKGQKKEIDVFPALTKDERKLVPRTNCGLAWFGNARPSGTGVEIDVLQSSTPFEPSWFATVRIERSTLALTRVASPKPPPAKRKKK